MKQVAIVAAFLLASFALGFAAPAGYSDVATDCIMEEAVGAIQFAAITRVAEIAKQELPMLKAFEAINRKAKDPKRPLKEQLSKDDIAQFARLQQQREMLTLYRLIESGYERDAKVIQRLFFIANALYVGGQEPKEGEQDYAYFLKLLGLRLMSTQEFKWTINTPTDLSTCNIETALHLIEFESIQKMGRLDIDGGMRALRDILSKNNMTKIERSKLNAQDRAALDRLQRNVMAPAEKEQAFIGDIENLKDLWSVASLQYQANKKDITDSAGDPNSIGTTLAKSLPTGRKRLLLKVLDKIAEDFPSDYVNQLKLISRAVDQFENPAKPQPGMFDDLIPGNPPPPGYVIDPPNDKWWRNDPVATKK
jgi:hypothetical protein